MRDVRKALSWSLPLWGDGLRADAATLDVPRELPAGILAWAPLDAGGAWLVARPWINNVAVVGAVLSLDHTAEKTVLRVQIRLLASVWVFLSWVPLVAVVPTTHPTGPGFRVAAAFFVVAFLAINILAGARALRRAALLSASRAGSSRRPAT